MQNDKAPLWTHTKKQQQQWYGREGQVNDWYNRIKRKKSSLEFFCFVIVLYENDVFPVFGSLFHALMLCRLFSTICFICVLYSVFASLFHSMVLFCIVFVLFSLMWSVLIESIQSILLSLYYAVDLHIVGYQQTN